MCYLHPLNALTAADDTLKYFLLFSKENMAGHFMVIACLADDSQESSNLIFLKK